jgi:hypothetical protein
MSENIDPENLESFMMPDSILEKLFELSGDANQSKGFILAFVDQDGKPIVFTRTQNKIIEMGLRKSLEMYLIESEESENMYRNIDEDDFEE